jgi:hypothetical protein
VRDSAPAGSATSPGSATRISNGFSALMITLGRATNDLAGDLHKLANGIGDPDRPPGAMINDASRRLDVTGQEIVGACSAVTSELRDLAADAVLTPERRDAAHTIASLVVQETDHMRGLVQGLFFDDQVQRKLPINIASLVQRHTRLVETGLHFVQESARQARAIIQVRKR